MYAAREVLDITSQIRPLLAGRDPEMQGAVLADLVSLWLAGYSSAAREEMLLNWIMAVRHLVPVNLREMFPNGPPPGWQD